MKTLLKIAVAGLVVFQVLAIAQEWDYFSSIWFGVREPPPELTESEREEATHTVYLTLSLLRHVYGSGGDPRFSERMPVSELLIEEVREDVAYLERNRRRQDPELVGFEVLAIEPLDAERVEIRTREGWIHRWRRLEGGGELDPPSRQIVHGKYLLRRHGDGWRLEAWDFVTTGAPEGEPQDTGPRDTEPPDTEPPDTDPPDTVPGEAVP